MITSDPNEDLVETIGKLNKNRIGRVPVVENGELVGIVSKTDITNTLQKKELKLDYINSLQFQILIIWFTS